jgi:hypothetical protein
MVGRLYNVIKSRVNPNCTVIPKYPNHKYTSTIQPGVYDENYGNFGITKYKNTVCV